MQTLTDAHLTVKTLDHLWYIVDIFCIDGTRAHADWISLVCFFFAQWQTQAVAFLQGQTLFFPGRHNGMTDKLCWEQEPMCLSARTPATQQTTSNPKRVGNNGEAKRQRSAPSCQRNQSTVAMDVNNKQAYTLEVDHLTLLSVYCNAVHLCTSFRHG